MDQAAQRLTRVIIMAMHIIKPKGRTRHVIQVMDHHGARLRVAGPVDRRLSEQMGLKLERLVACARLGEPVPPDLMTFIENMRAPLKATLIKRGILGARFLSAGERLDVLIDRYEQSLKDANKSQAHWQRTSHRVRMILLERCGYERYSYISADTVMGVLAKFRAEPRKIKGRRINSVGVVTANHYLRAVKMFCVWMSHPSRAGTDPMRHIKQMPTKSEKLKPRRSMTVAEQIKLLSATPNHPTRYHMTGDERALLYRFALETGLRAGEIDRLRVDHIEQHAGVTSVKVIGKNGEQVSIPMRPELAKLILDQTAMSLPTAKVFPRLPRPSNLSRMLTHDLAEAGIVESEKVVYSYLDRHGKQREKVSLRAVRTGGTVDFHALRHTFATTLARAGVQPKQLQELMRHKSIQTTMGYYVHTLVSDKLHSLELLPDLTTPAPSQLKKVDQA
jgi:integrase